MISENFVYLALVFNLVGSISYAVSTVKGKTKPNRVTWFLWALIPIVAFMAQIGEGVGIQSLLTLAVGLGPLMIFISSFVNKKAFWRITKLDVFCGFISVCALILWLATGTGLIAIALSIGADLLAGIPTIVKSFNFPETENSVVFRNGAIGSGITILTIDNWTFAEYGFVIYILCACLLCYSLIRFKLGKKIKSLIATA